MPQEIEKKYLVKGEQWRNLATGTIYIQGYIPTLGNQTVRVRLIGEQGYLTIKGPIIGITRSEFEYPIPSEDAREMLFNLCSQPLIEKKRYQIKHQDLIWEVDEFFGENLGLIIAEVELNSENQAIAIPDWIDCEVNDPKYFNSNLIKHPYSKWQKNNQ